MVRLIASGEMGGGFKHARFQFQNGSINSPPDARERRRRVRFQFQNGSINSLVLVLVHDSEPGFNSKMVRLIAARPYGWPCATLVSIPKWFD